MGFRIRVQVKTEIDLFKNRKPSNCNIEYCARIQAMLREASAHMCMYVQPHVLAQFHFLCAREQLKRLVAARALGELPRMQ